VASAGASLSSSRLRRLARQGAERKEAELEHCELCSEPIPANHRHLLDLRSGELMCACQACKILFDRREAGVGHYRLVPERRLELRDFVLDDARWDALRIPVEMAFFHSSSRAERVVALYPSPAGPTESQLELDAWQQIVADNPVLESMEQDVEALLVNRARGARQVFLVPIEDPYRLVALIRTRWRGLTGGKEVWEEIERFYEALAQKSKTHGADREEVA
jgi:DNA-binding transcriptional ArsR family regulator